LTFILEGEHKDLDRQIQMIRTEIVEETPLKVCGHFRYIPAFSWP